MQGAQLHCLMAETTVWRTWIGFNASHSLCAILFGLIFGYLALSAAGAAVPRCITCRRWDWACSWPGAGKLYWFNIPFMGVSLALGCYVGGLVAARVLSVSPA